MLSRLKSLLGLRRKGPWVSLPQLKEAVVYRDEAEEDTMRGLLEEFERGDALALEELREKFEGAEVVKRKLIEDYGLSS